MTKYTATDRCTEYSHAPAVGALDFDIRYACGRSSFTYDLYCGTTWVASALTNGDADDVADEMIYRAFLVQPDVIGGYTDPDEPGEDEPGDTCPDHGPYDDDECPKCVCCGASSAPILDGGRRVCVACHVRECHICAALPRCASCGDTLLEFGPVVCEMCAGAGFCAVCGADHTALHCPEVILMRQAIDEIAQLRTSLLATPYAALAQ